MLRLEGTRVLGRGIAAEGLRERLAGFGALDELHAMDSERALARDRATCGAAAEPRERWSGALSVPPSVGARVAAAIAGRAEAEHALRLGRRTDLARRRRRAGRTARGGRLRATPSPASGGHATLIRAPDALRAAVAVFEPQPGAARRALAARVKESFDPRRMLNPGRMYAGV